MSAPLIATAKAVNANSYVNVARATTILRRRPYTTAWDNASALPSANGFLTNGSAIIGATSVAVDGGTGTWTAGTIVKFAGHDTEYTVAANLSGAGTLTLTSGLTAAVADNEQVLRETPNDREKALMWATQLLDAMMVWKGFKRTREQALWFPATGVLNESGDSYDYDTIPVILEVGTAELARHLLEGDVFRPPNALGKGVSKVKLGPLEATIDNSQQMPVIPDNILSLLSQLGSLESQAMHGSYIVPLKRV